MPVGLGLCLPGVGPTGVGLDAAALGEVAAAAERDGVDSLWVAEGRPGADGTDPVTVAAALARATTRCTVGVLADVGGGRGPSLLAKELTTLDRLSAGRAALALGWGPWADQPPPAPDHRAARSADHRVDQAAVDRTGDQRELGPAVDLPPGAAPVGVTAVARGLADRARWIDEAATVCRGMWTTPSFTFTGAHLSVTDAVNHPPPVRPGGPLLLLRLADRGRTLRSAARHGAGVVTGRSVDAVRRTVRAAAGPGGGVPVVAWRRWVAGRPAEALAAEWAALRAAGADGVIVALAGAGPVPTAPADPVAAWIEAAGTLAAGWRVADAG